MKFGLSFLPDATPETKSASDYYHDTLALSVQADKAGLGTIKMTEHYLKAYGGYCPSPLAFLSAVAALTRDIRLMTGCILPTFSHPIKMASECSMVDAISNGRLDVGFARAYLPYEFASFGVDMNTSRDRFQESVKAIIQLWSEEESSADTPYFAYNKATLLPPPVQSPTPPIFVAAVRSRSSFAWIAEQGMGLLVTSALSKLPDLRDYINIYLESFTSSPLDPSGQPKVILSIPLYIAPDNETAFKEGDHYIQHYHNVWADAAASWNTAASSDYPSYTGLVHAIKALTPEVARSNSHAIVGAPEKVISDIEHILSVLPIDDIIWQLDFGAQPLETSKRTLQLFTDQVMPHFQS